MLSRKAFLATGGGCLSLAGRGFGAGVNSRPKNVLVLLSDQHKPDAMGWAGDRNARTPHLDALAAGSTAFRSAYCSNPVCAPARASILTGLYTHHHGTLRNDKPWPAAVPSVAHRFGRAGYFSALIGKSHFTDAQTHGFDYRLDFNEWFQYLGPKTQLYVDELPGPNGGCGFPHVVSLWESGDPWKDLRKPEAREMTTIGGPSPMAEADHFDSWVARESIRFLDGHASRQPFLLIASFLKPHAPFTPPPRFIDPNWKRSFELPRSYGKVDLENVPRYIRAHIAKAETALKDPEKARMRLAHYYGCIAHLDDCVGQIVRHLEKTGLLENTVIVYTSDHGDMCGEHGLWNKFVFYESSAGVPLLVRAPGIAQAGAVCRAPVSQVALMPTLLDLCGLPIPAGLDETSLVPFLRDPARKQDRPVFSEFALGTKSEKYMLRRGDWKYSHYLDDSPELYNLRDDPDELANLAASPRHAGEAGRLRDELLAWRAR